MIAGTIGAIVLVGCSSVDVQPFRARQAAPTALSGPLDHPPRRTVIVVGAFNDPAGSPVKWTKIGDGFGDAFARALIAEGKFDVRINDRAAERTAKAVRAGGEAETSFAAIRADYPDVDFVIAGSLASFAPGSLGGEAHSAVDLTIVDLRAGETLFADRVASRAPVKVDTGPNRYAHLSFDSVAFWELPLGIASRKTIVGGVERVRAKVPTHAAEFAVLSIEGWRHLTVHAGSAHGVARGQRYFVYLSDRGGAMRPIHDETTREPLMAQITEVGKERSKAWLMGEPPPSVNIAHAVLVRDPPRMRMAGVAE